MNFEKAKTGFFSMEIGINEDVKTYAGGLGILAGDALKSCADLQLPVAGVTLLYKKGYFKQKIDENGNQIEEEQNWDYQNILKKLDTKVKVRISGEDVVVGCWAYEIEGVAGGKKPVFFLDTDIEENNEYYRTACHRLYQGDRRDRIVQEIILGIGGVEMLKSLGFEIEKYHMNEGHTSFLPLALYKTHNKEEIRKKCVFTTHTPVPAGHDIFEESLVREVAGEYLPQDISIFENGKLNMTHLGLKFAGYINGVARKHRQTSGKMFPRYDIESITNGIHARTWVSEPFKELFTKHIPEWHDDPFTLRAAINIPQDEIWEAHAKAKRQLIEEVKEKTGQELDFDKLTIGFARRFVEYKRPHMIFNDLDRLRTITKEKGNIQVIFSGKAHPSDPTGKRLIQEILEIKGKIQDENIRIVFLEDYSIKTAKHMIAGCDIWLNNPKRPHEASGTSGMKAAINGVPHFSVLDGWWLEGHVEDVTGWSIGLHPYDPTFNEDKSPDDEAEDFYRKLEEKVLPLFYHDKDNWIKMMKSCIAINGSFFHTHRMMQQYVIEAYIK